MSPTVNLPEKIVTLHRAFRDARLPHAFGGALALAWCTQSARGTIDIDINVFVSVDRAEGVFAALPAAVRRSPKELRALVRDTQVRVWWDTTPLDLFLNSTPYHEEVQTRTRWEDFAGARIPFLSCSDLAVFKAFFNRTQDWADLEAMHQAGTLDWRQVAGVLIEYSGADDERIERLRSLATASE